MIQSICEVKSDISPTSEKIKEVLYNWLGDDEFSCHYFLRGLKNKNTICTYAAYEKEKLVGLITAWNSEIHPYCTYFSMVTGPHIRYDIEFELLNYLLNTKKIKQPLQTSIWETSYRLKAFYEQNEFLEVRRTYTPSLNVSKVDLEQIIPQFNQQGISIKDLGSIADHQALKFQLINLVKENYEKAHIVNPVSNQSNDWWERQIFNTDLIENGSYILIIDSEIYAYSLLHHSNTPDKYEFGWRGTRYDVDIRLMLMLTAHQINFAEKNGIKFIEAEVDSTDNFSIEMLKFFPFSPAPALLTFQKKFNIV
ncbi:GNAT family acetyltransferase [Sutcliffiella horikoshii]|uniref:GNAT family acetyltransferase n=1 Tax=Sutcliffiella horikoshii TaxID=79883 RepID=UPI003CF298CB